MKKLTMSLIGLAFVLCAFSAQAAGIGEACNSTADCPDDIVYCNGVPSCSSANSTCVATLPSCSGGTPFCDETKDTCVECLSNDNCTDDEVYCNGDEVCNAGSCESDGNPCGGETPYCVEANDTCVECLVNGDCDDGVFCNGTETCSVNSCVAGVTPCEDGVVCDEDNDACVECITDDNCTDEAKPFCNANNACVECVDNSTCTDDGDPCNGTEVCNSGTCGSTGDPCSGQICIPGINPNDYTCQDCVSDDNCTDALYCNGAESCSNGTCYSDGDPCIEEGSSLPAAYGPICDEANDACVECITDDNCTDVAKPFCDDTNACVECLSDGNCDDGVFCNGTETCDNGTCMPFEGDVCEGGEICNEEIEQCVGCLDDGDCEGDNNTPRCGESFQCVQCVDELDCAEDQLCNEEGTCVTAECELKIKPNKIRINRMFRPVERKFKITGSDGFDPYAEMDFGILEPNVRTASVDKKGRLRVLVIVPTRARLYKGPVEIRVGNCVGFVELK